MNQLVNEGEYVINSGRSIAELQVSGVKTNFTKRPYDTSMSFTVHSLLVVDALQTFGSDFELLVASHKSLWYAYSILTVTFDNRMFLFC